MSNSKNQTRLKKSKSLTNRSEILKTEKDLTEQINKEAEKRLRSFLQAGIYYENVKLVFYCNIFFKYKKRSSFLNVKV